MELEQPYLFGVGTNVTSQNVYVSIISIKVLVFFVALSVPVRLSFCSTSRPVHTEERGKKLRRPNGFSLHGRTSVDRFYSFIPFGRKNMDIRHFTPSSYLLFKLNYGELLKENIKEEVK